LTYVLALSTLETVPLRKSTYALHAGEATLFDDAAMSGRMGFRFQVSPGAPATSRALAVYDPEFAAGQLRLAGRFDEAVSLENSYGLWERGSFRTSTHTNAVSQFSDEAGTLRCLCGEEIPATITVTRKGQAVQRIGYDLDHFNPTWVERVRRMQQLPIPVRRKLVLDVYNQDVRPLCPQCNQSHTFEGR
jgi:hypothetical protein